jgi:hypothetical protein
MICSSFVCVEVGLLNKSSFIIVFLVWAGTCVGTQSVHRYYFTGYPYPHRHTYHVFSYACKYGNCRVVGILYEVHSVRCVGNRLRGGGLNSNIGVKIEHMDLDLDSDRKHCVRIRILNIVNSIQRGQRQIFSLVF